jgi:hypothetical protein
MAAMNAKERVLRSRPPLLRLVALSSAMLCAACGDDETDDNGSNGATAALTLSLAPPSNGLTCPASTSGNATYALGSIEAPIEHGGGNEVTCTVTEDAEAYEGSATGTDANGGGEIRISVRDVDGLWMSLSTEATATLTSNPRCFYVASAVVGNMVSVDFECDLVAMDASNNGCNATGTLTLEGCATGEVSADP